jgi:hypothetical protein
MVAASEYTTQTAKDLLVAATIIEALDEHSLSTSQIQDLFFRNLSSGRVRRALELLERAGLVVQTRDEGTGGRPATIWTAI